MSQSIGRRTARNSISSLMVNSWYLLSRFLLTPLTLHYLALNEYGLWSLCFVVMSFLAMTSMGIEGAYIKYVAEFHAHQQSDRINRLLSTGLVLTSLIALVFLCGLWLSMDWLLDLLKISASLRDTARVLFLGTGLAFALDISLNGFGRVLDGMQQIELTSRVRFVTTFLEIVLIILFLVSGFGIFGLLAAFLIRYLLAILINMYLAFRLIPELRIGFGYCDRASLKLLLKYGGQLQFLGFVGIFMGTFDRLVITRFLGLAATGLYEVGRKLPATGTSIPAVISGAMMPALSHLQSLQDMTQARALFMVASRYMAMISAYIFTSLFVVAPYAIYVWLGPGYDEAVGVMYVISAGALINLLTGTGSAATKGFGRLDLEMKYALLNLLLCLVMAPLLTLQFGLIGAAMGVAGSKVIASLYFIGITNRLLKVGLPEYFRQVLHPLFASILSAAGLFAALHLLIDLNTNSRPLVAAILLAATALHLLVSGLLLWLSRGLMTTEKHWLQQRIENLSAFLARRRLS